MRYEFSGALTAQDAKRHLAYSFEVAPGTTRITLRLRFTPQAVGGRLNMLDPSLFDPQQTWRGTAHRHAPAEGAGATHEVVVGVSQASPGFIAGPLPPGVWQAAIDTHGVQAGEPCSYTLTVETSDAPEDAAASQAQLARPALPARGPGWFRGDIHGHSLHSDADWSVTDLVAQARRFGLDFVTLTDHNTTSGLLEMDSLTGPDLLTMGGIEFTTYYGHALGLGLRRWVDWRTQGERRMADVLADTEAAGGMFVIAHPMSVGDPWCTGCNWLHDELMPGGARCVEVWNGPWVGESNNEAALQLWYAWLNARLRLVGTAGTDIHGPPSDDRPYGWNVVYAEELREQAILRAIAQGHSYLSSGPQLLLSARSTGGQQAMSGDSLPQGPATLQVRWQDCPPGSRLRLIVDGKPHAAVAAEAQGEQNWQLAAGQASWCSLELRGQHGVMLALTNPIFFERKAE